MAGIQDFVYTAEHDIYYNTKVPVPIADVIEALQGLERILRSLPRALEKATAIDIIESQVFVERIESGSLYETILIKVFFKSQEDLDAFVEKMCTRLDGHPMIKGALITALVAAMVGYGIFLASRSTSAPAQNITANNNVIINIGAGEVGLTPEAFRSIVETAVTDKKDFAKAAVKLVRPARADRGSTITVDGNADLQITAEAIAQTPEAVNIEPMKRVDELEGITLVIRAGDMDQVKTGWAGAVTGMTERLPIELDPTLNPTAIFGRQQKQFQADVALTFHQDRRSGTMVPRSIFVRKIY